MFWGTCLLKKKHPRRELLFYSYNTAVGIISVYEVLMHKRKTTVTATFSTSQLYKEAKSPQKSRRSKGCPMLSRMTTKDSMVTCWFWTTIQLLQATDFSKTAEKKCYLSGSGIPFRANSSYTNARESCGWPEAILIAKKFNNSWYSSE
jgi:hypothetical protein